MHKKPTLKQMLDELEKYGTVFTFIGCMEEDIMRKCWTCQLYRGNEIKTDPKVGQGKTKRAAIEECLKIVRGNLR